MRVLLVLFFVIFVFVELHYVDPKKRTAADIHENTEADVLGKM